MNEIEQKNKNKTNEASENQTKKFVKFSPSRKIRNELSRPRIPKMDQYKETLRLLDPQKTYLLPVSGYKNLNCNMTVLIHDKRIVIIDAGSYTDVPENTVLLTEQFLGKQPRKYAKTDLLVHMMLNLGYKLEAVIITHNHADHVGGAQNLAEVLKDEVGLDLKTVPLYISHYAYEYSKKNINFKNVIFMEDYQKLDLWADMSVYTFFLNHSSLNSVALYFKTSTKKILFLPDHRIDYYGSDSDVMYLCQDKIFQTLKKINLEKPDCVVLESTRGFTTDFKLNLSEEAVCTSLKNTLSYLAAVKDTILVSTYATNPIRIRAVLQAAKKTNRLVAILGTSISHAVDVGFKLGLYQPELRAVCRKMTSDLKEVNNNKKKYIILCTGHMGEHRAGLYKILKNVLYYKWSLNDVVILSSTTIPKEACVFNRGTLLLNLKARRVLVLDGDHYPELHTSGHLANQDYYRLISTLKDARMFVINHGDFHPALSLYGCFELLNIATERVKAPRNYEVLEL